MNTIASRVQLGAELLDAHSPNWESVINPRTLDIESSCRCVLGQVFGDYHVAWEHVGIVSVRDAFEHGFTNTNFAVGDEPAKPIEQEWKRLIKARLKERAK